MLQPKMGLAYKYSIETDTVLSTTHFRFGSLYASYPLETRNAIQHMCVCSFVGTWIFCPTDPSHARLLGVGCGLLSLFL